MRVSLLYKDRDVDRLWDGAYADEKNIIQDLGLNTLFRAAGRQLIHEDGRVVRVDREDPFLSETMRRVMMVPLASREEIEYRQEVLKDCFGREELLRALYHAAGDALREWNTLTNGAREKAQQSNQAARLFDVVRALKLLCDSLTQIRHLLFGEDHDTGERKAPGFRSEGFRAFLERFAEAFPPEKEQALRKVLRDIAFFTGGTEDPDGRENRTFKPKIVLECGLEDGLKFSSPKLVEIASENMKFYRPGTAMKKLQDIRYSRIPDSFPVERDMRLGEQAKALETGVVGCLAENVMSEFMDEFRSFFDQLKRQIAFCLGAVQLAAHLKYDGLDFCFPEAADRETLSFLELRECVLGMERHMRVVGNACSLDGKSLVIVTGANQGGKSTFLRSIGIAQVMMQCGLPVTARSFRSGIFPRIFAHFTRREDSSMNSGRLDEELGRMDRIVEKLGDGSLLLLNESFATTTEKEGSVIAYDIVRALKEAGVKILMVTHLLSFAGRVYAETKDRPDTGVEFLSAEREPDGRRTFRMIRHGPERTSFGLDLYEEIVEKKIGASGPQKTP